MTTDKGFIGLASGTITTVILQPFENIKMALMISPKDLVITRNFAKNFINATQYIYNINGHKGFYKGLVAATLKAATGCFVYFGILRQLEKGITEKITRTQKFYFSCLARIVSTIVTNPLNIIQTRFQLVDFHGYKTVHGAIKDIYLKEGLKGFFTGCLASCIKEGIFAGCYYMIYTQLKDCNLSKFPAGVLGGMIATAMTHPFQLIRARLMILGLKQNYSNKKHLIIKQLLSLRQNKQWLKGLTPRLIKKPIANTITFYLFQMIQQLHKKHILDN